MIYGKIKRADGSPINTGYTLDEVRQLALDCHEGEIEIYEATGDLAIGPTILQDMVKHIEELESKLASQNS